MNNEADRLDQRIRPQSRRQAAHAVGDAVSRPAAVATARAKKSARGGDARRAPVVGAVWRDAQGQTRLRLTYITRSTVDFLNLTTDGHGVMSRAWLENHFTAES